MNKKDVPADSAVEQPLQSNFYRECRCPHCHRLLFKEFIFKGRLQIVCPGSNCGKIVVMVWRGNSRPKRSNQRRISKEHKKL